MRYKNKTRIINFDKSVTYMILRYFPMYHTYKVLDMTHDCIKELPQDLVESSRYKPLKTVFAWKIEGHS